MIGRLSPTPIPTDTGDFRLLSPRALQALRQIRERHRFMKGLFGWVGFRQIALPYRREPRLSGRSRVHLLAIMELCTGRYHQFLHCSLTGHHLPRSDNRRVALATVSGSYSKHLFSAIEYLAGQQ